MMLSAGRAVDSAGDFDRARRMFLEAAAMCVGKLCQTHGCFAAGGEGNITPKCGSASDRVMQRNERPEAPSEDLPRPRCSP